MPPSSPRPEYQDNQSPPNQRPVYSRPIFPGTVPGSATPHPAPPSMTPTPRSKRTVKDSSRRQQTQSMAQSMVQPMAQPMAQSMVDPENTTLTREAAYASVSALRKRSKVCYCCSRAGACKRFLLRNFLSLSQFFIAFAIFLSLSQLSIAFATFYRFHNFLPLLQFSTASQFSIASQCSIDSQFSIESCESIASQFPSLSKIQST